MNSARHGLTTPGRPGHPSARLLEQAAMAILLVVLVARPFVNEVPYRSTRALPNPGEAVEPLPAPDELVRVTFAMLLLLAGVLWVLAAVVRRRIQLCGVLAGVLILLFVVWSLPSCFRAVDVRGALNGWLEQAALLAAAFVMMQLSAGGRRWGLVVVVLGAMAGTMGLKACIQRTIELPERVGEFQADPAKQLAMIGIQPGTPQARMFEKRLRDPSAYGYLFLSNVFSSLMIVLMMAGVGLAVEKFRAAGRARRLGPPPGRGEIHLPTLAAIPAGLVALLAVAALVLSGSKGGIAAGAAALLGGGLLLWRSAFCARHRRQFLAICALALLAGAGAFAAYGSARGEVPTRSMQVRWEYWVGTIGVIGERPLIGIGADNFSYAYVRHRLPEAAESTKLAHNSLLDAAVQFGLPGAALYLAILIWLVAAITRPAPAPAETQADPPTGGNIRPVLWLVLLPLVVAAIRALWLGSTNVSLVVVEAILPAIAFAVLLLAGMWAGTRLDPALPCGSAARIALGCGLAGFLMHNLVESTLWVPATSTVFWITAGAAAGAACPVRARALGPLPRTLAAVPAVLAFVAVGVWLYRPVLARALNVRSAEIALLRSPDGHARGDISGAAACLRQAVQADPLDATAPGELARLYLSAAATVPPARARPTADLALHFAETAWRRTPSADNAILLAKAYWLRDEPSALRLAWRGRGGNLEEFRAKVAQTIARQGASAELLNALAEVQFASGQLDEAYYTIAAAIEAAGGAQPALYDRLGDLAWQLGKPELAAAAWRAYLRVSSGAMKNSPAADCALRAVELDPMDESLRMTCADVLIAAGRLQAARHDLDELRRIDAVRPLNSDLRLIPGELARLDLLEAKIEAARRLQ